MIFPPPEYSKRVYQGVRVKHTVKDLLAEKRSRQTGVPHFPVSDTSMRPLFLSPPALSPPALSPPAPSPPAPSSAALSPAALCPPALCPPALSPAALCPPALSPAALSSAALCPPALCPPALSPAALSSAALSSAALCPPALSPAALSPAALSAAPFFPSLFHLCIGKVELRFSSPWHDSADLLRWLASLLGLSSSATVLSGDLSSSEPIRTNDSMRRPFISEAEFSTSSKQLSTDVHSSALTGKSVSCDPVPIQYQSLLDGYYTESFSDYCGAGLAGGGSTIFSSSTLSTLLPSLPADTSNFVLRDSWETAATEVMEGLCADSLVPAPLMGSLSGSELHSPGQYRASSKGSVVPSSLFYPLHPLEDGHYPSPFQPAPGGFVYPTYTAVSGQSTTKTAALSSAETENPPLLSDTFPWVREDTSSGPWSQYEIRRAF
ncbi:hypothetical protein P4O66_017601 [Electrophorus voltai]|uniref:OCA domain-containing protein n=1 Tax=Electrophorus voltai TaxID=2609070 RepID=A0AAD8YT38_9TELE|nr:hypothetical protein P4O66_017601 [Electrophorus voltai]